jgi:hypothetical protein
MKLLIVGLSAAILAIASVGVAAGGKGTLTVDPTPVPQGSTFTLSGCGYPTPSSLTFRVVGPGTDYSTAGEPLPLADGCFSDEWTAWWSETGSYSITSYYRDAKGALRKVAVVKFAVK